MRHGPPSAKQLPAPAATTPPSQPRKHQRRRRRRGRRRRHGRRQRRRTRSYRRLNHRLHPRRLRPGTLRLLRHLPPLPRPTHHHPLQLPRHFRPRRERKWETLQHLLAIPSELQPVLPLHAHLACFRPATLERFVFFAFVCGAAELWRGFRVGESGVEADGLGTSQSLRMMAEGGMELAEKQRAGGTGRGNGGSGRKSDHDLDREAAAALSMLNHDRRGWRAAGTGAGSGGAMVEGAVGGGGSTGMSVRDLLSG